MLQVRVRFVQRPLGSWHAEPPESPPDPPVTSSVDVPWVLEVGWTDDFGLEHEGLPKECRDVGPMLDAARVLLAEHYDDTEVGLFDLDATIGWTSESARVEFIRTMEAVRRWIAELAGPLPHGLRVDFAPGLVEVRLAGEYMCEWPLWTTGGAGDREDWPDLDDALAERLLDWGRRADPGHDPQPSPDETERLAVDLRRALGSRYRVEYS